jgi:hypothetical protein
MATNKDNKTLHNKKILVQAMTKSLGVVTQACKLANLDRRTFYTYYNEDAEFKAEIDDIKDIALDFVEGQLLKQINSGEISSTIFYLKTKGKNRGYVEKSELEHTGRIIVRIPDEDDDKDY